MSKAAASSTALTIDVKSIYGYDDIQEGMTFKDGKNLTQFIQDVNFNNGYRVKLGRCGGTGKVYQCATTTSSPQGCCPWLVRVHRKKESSSFVYRITHSNTVHTCRDDTRPPPTARQKDLLQTTNNNSCKSNPQLSITSLTDIPKEFQIKTYFSKSCSSEFEHWDLFNNSVHVFDVLKNLPSYIQHHLDNQMTLCTNNFILQNTLINAVQVAFGNETSASCFYPDKVIGSTTTFKIKVGCNVKLYGGVFDLSTGHIEIQDNVVIQPGVYLQGPIVIGNDVTLRSGAYVRGPVIIGPRTVVRCEIKGSVLLDRVEVCHPGYVGDSIIGSAGHFGNQVTASNLGLSNKTTTTQCITTNDSIVYDTSLRKVGLILGDQSQIGCSAVTDPCTLIRPRTIVYPLTRLPKGIYGPDEIIKNKPLEAGVIKRVPMNK